MRAYIKKLQSKEEIVRKQILVCSLVVSMAVVAMVWTYSLNDRFGHKEVVTTNTPSDTKPFTLFKNSISSTYNNILASVGNFSSSKKNVDTSASTEKQIDLIVVEHPSAQ